PSALGAHRVPAAARSAGASAPGHHARVLVLPPGSGKTVIAAELIRHAVAAGERVLFVAPRRELIAQTSEKLDAIGLGHGVIQAGADERAGLRAAVHVASVDTLTSRVLRRRTLMLPRY